MDATRLRRLIDEKNERREESALRTAANLIDEIAKEQQNISESNARIVRLRKELSELEVEQVDPAVILGS